MHDPFFKKIPFYFIFPYNQENLIKPSSFKNMRNVQLVQWNPQFGGDGFKKSIGTLKCVKPKEGFTKDSGH